jgi:post-segregation antitoxin (ccd killing protein)
MVTMARLNILLDDDLAKRLRIRAVEVYGGEKGSLSQAISDAVRFWLEKAPSKKK